MTTTYQQFYAKCTNPYGVKGPLYGSTGHHGCDFAVGTHGAVPAYFTGICALNGHSSVLGNYTVYRVGSVFIGYAHLLTGTRQNVGTTVHPGDVIGLAAGPADDHGSAWTGPHCHTTRSNSMTGIWDGNTMDPLPGIENAIRATVPASKPVKRSSTHARPGEGGIRVAARSKISFERLQQLNPGVNMSKLRLGQKLWTS